MGGVESTFKILRHFCKYCLWRVLNDNLHGTACINSEPNQYPSFQCLSSISRTKSISISFSFSLLPKAHQLLWIKKSELCKPQLLHVFNTLFTHVEINTFPIPVNLPNIVLKHIKCSIVTESPIQKDDYSSFEIEAQSSARKGIQRMMYGKVFIFSAKIC